MVRINIKDLTYLHEQDLLDEINWEEMTNIQGGMRRRWRTWRGRRRDPIQIDRENLSTGIESLDARIDRWERELDETQSILNSQLNF
jgi:hypothetical protein